MRTRGRRDRGGSKRVRKVTGRRFEGLMRRVDEEDRLVERSMVWLPDWWLGSGEQVVSVLLGTSVWVGKMMPEFGKE